MAVTYQIRLEPAPPERLAELERRIGRPLPAAYREHLLQQDGGRLSENNDAAKIVFGVGNVPDWASMWRKLDTYAGRVPGWLLPAASDEYGNLFAVSVRDDDEGSVWFWDHEAEADEGEPPTEENLEYRAKDWPTFLAQLQPINAGDG